MITEFNFLPILNEKAFFREIPFFSLSNKAILFSGRFYDTYTDRVRLGFKTIKVILNGSDLSEDNNRIIDKIYGTPPNIKNTLDGKHQCFVPLGAIFKAKYFLTANGYGILSTAFISCLLKDSMPYRSDT